MNLLLYPHGVSLGNLPNLVIEEHFRILEVEADGSDWESSQMWILDLGLSLDQIPLKRGYLAGAPGVDWNPPNSFRPSAMVTVRALATLLPSLAR